jgi:hypothetical protein
MAEFEVLQVVPSEPEAEVIRGLLESEGIPAFVRQTSAGAGMTGGLPGAGGTHEILVHATNLAAARELLQQQGS